MIFQNDSTYIWNVYRTSLVKHWFICNIYFDHNSNNPVVLGPNNSNLPRIFSIIADGEIHEAIKHEDPCTKRLANVVRQVQVNTCLFHT